MKPRVEVTDDQVDIVYDEYDDGATKSRLSLSVREDGIEVRWLPGEYGRLYIEPELSNVIHLKFRKGVIAFGQQGGE